MPIGRVTAKNFRKQVLGQSGPVLLVFTAKFCDASQRLIPIVDELADAFDGRARIAHLDLGSDEAVARTNAVCQRYRVSRLPLVMLFDDGRVVDFIGGIPSRADLADMLDRQLQPVLDVGEHNFKQQVLESKVPVLVHFHSASCKQSKELIPLVDTTAERFRGRARVVRVEANAFNARVCAEYGAIRFPMLATFEGGQMRDCILGAVSDAGLRSAGLKARKAEDHVAEMVEAAFV